MQIYSTEEKLDYIFEELKFQKKARIWKMVIKIVFLLALIFLYFNYLHWISKEELNKNISTFLSNLVEPIAKNLVNDMIEQQNSQSSEIPQDEIEKIIKNQKIINNIK